MRKIILAAVLVAAFCSLQTMFPTEAQQPKPPETVYLLRPAAIFDGESAELHRGLGRAGARRKDRGRRAGERG